MQRQMDDKNSDLRKLRQEQQRLLGLIRSLESDIEDLKRQISGLEKTNQDKVTQTTCGCVRSDSVASSVSKVCVSLSRLQDKTIANLKKKNMELEKLKFICDVQVNELKRQIEPQQDDLKEKRERVRQVCLSDDRDKPSGKHVYTYLADAMVLLTAGGEAGGDGRHQHPTETQRVQPGPPSEDGEQRVAEGDAEGEQRPVDRSSGVITKATSLWVWFDCWVHTG